MRSTLLFLLCYGIPTIAFAQDYSCISQETKTFFTNNIHYLRGMRIDSILMDVVAKTYYPYKTARVDDFYSQDQADSTGGSWFGKRIVETAEGITYFENKWDDTMIIQNNATLNDSWLFYNDTTNNIVYEAKVIAIDTYTVIDFTDSVKVIMIKAMDGINEIVSDPLNNLKLILSKEHGFIQAIDFYLFPYHQPSLSSFNAGFDAYFPLANGADYQLRKENLTFKRVNFQPVYKDVLNDFDIGDEFYGSRYSYSSYATGNYHNKSIIINKETNGTSIEYQMANWSWGYYTNSNTGLTNVSDSSITTFSVDHSIVFDLDKLPEEWIIPFVYYYNPQDTSFCVRSLAYTINSGPITEGGYLDNFEPSGTRSSFKVKIGRTYQEDYATVMDNNGLVGSQSLDAVKKNQYKCNSHNESVAINKIPERTMDFKIYPNPAKDMAIIEFPELDRKDKMTISLFNLSGQCLEKVETVAEKVQLDIRGKAAGLYLLQIVTNNFSVVRKIVIE